MFGKPPKGAREPETCGWLVGVKAVDCEKLQSKPRWGCFSVHFEAASSKWTLLDHLISWLVVTAASFELWQVSITFQGIEKRVATLTSQSWSGSLAQGAMDKNGLRMHWSSAGGLGLSLMQGGSQQERSHHANIWQDKNKLFPKCMFVLKSGSWAWKGWRYLHYWDSSMI